MLGFTRMTLSLTRIQPLSHKPGLMATPPAILLQRRPWMEALLRGPPPTESPLKATPIWPALPPPVPKLPVPAAQHPRPRLLPLRQTPVKMESARNSLTTGLGLSKKFSKISMGPPPKITPGADAKDPSIVGTLQGAIGNLLSLKTDLPKLITSAVDLGKKAAEIPTSAKSDLAALGPVGSAQAVAKVAKQAKNISKILKDAKALADEVAMWSKVFGG